MASIIALLAVVLASLCSLGMPNPRQARSFDQMGDMIRMTTGRNPLQFNGYGHWCGPMSDPVDSVYDEIDRCCMIHDNCYYGLGRGNGSCSQSSDAIGRYFRRFEWHAEGSNIVCTNEEPCLQGVCECDRVVAECLGVHHHMYNSSYQTAWGRLTSEIMGRIG